MAIEVMVEVLEHSRTTLATRLVMIAIANNADKETREAWPSVKTIAEAANLSESAVHRSIRKAVDLGELAVAERFRDDGSKRSNLYTVLVTGGGAKMTPSPPGARMTPGRSQSGTRVVPPAAPLEPSEEPSLNRQGGQRAKKRAPTHRLPPDMALNEDRIREARQLSGFAPSRIETEWAKMADTEFAKPHTDWPAVWRNWIRREVKDEHRDARMAQARRADRDQAERARQAEGRAPSEPSRLGPKEYARVVPGVEATRTYLRRLARPDDKEDIGL